MARVLLTGSTGLLGTPVLEALVARGDDVRVLAPEDTVEDVHHRDKVAVVAGRLQDAEAVAEAAEGAEIVYHLAGALPGADADTLMDVNVRGTQALLEACVASAPRFVFISSVSVYKPAPFPFMWPIHEDREQLAHGHQQLHDYGQSKIDAEAAVRAWHDAHGAEYVILRPPVVYGIGAPFVERLLNQVIEHPRAAVAQGGSLGVMQWLHARDMADAVVLAGTRPGAANRAFNVGGPELITMAIVRAIVHDILTGGDAAPPWLPGRGRAMGAGVTDARLPGPYALRFDISSAREILGFSPQVRLREGLAEMLETMERPRRRRPGARFAGRTGGAAAWQPAGMP